MTDPIEDTLHGGRPTASILDLVQVILRGPLGGDNSRRDSALVSIITIIDGWYLTSRQEDKWKMRERRIAFERREPNPSRAHLGPFARWGLNRPGRDLVVDADTCGYANYYYECIAGCTRCGELPGNGINAYLTARATSPARAPIATIGM
jgi:hypothetical protein